VNIQHIIFNYTVSKKGLNPVTLCSDLLWEDIVGSREDVSHEGTVLDVLVITDDVDSVVAWFSRPVSDIT